LGWTTGLDELRLSQIKFAELLGISVKMLHNWEQGAARVL
jgi:DNA-binding transcriptional regulator YiaG